MPIPKAAVRRVVNWAAVLAFFPGTPSPAAPIQSFERSYNATAYITVFSIPIFSRTGVGYGSAMEQVQPGSGTQSVELQFLSGSVPERAHGLNRFGYIRELVQEKGLQPIKAEYFGVMTANREESLNDGKAALAAQNSGEVPYVAAQTEVENNSAHSSVRHLVLPAPRETGTADLVRRVEASFSARNRANPQDYDKTVGVSTAHTFLYSLRGAMLAANSNTHYEFLYNAKLYRLQTERHRDAKVEAEMVHLGLVDANKHVLRLAGTIENEATHDRTSFALWYEEGTSDTLPLRFEFRPKSFLKLVFDADPASRPGPSMASLRGMSHP